jgi:hypothetical protein
MRKGFLSFAYKKTFYGLTVGGLHMSSQYTLCNAACMITLVLRRGVRNISDIDMFFFSVLCKSFSNYS